MRADCFLHRHPAARGRPNFHEIPINQLAEARPKKQRDDFAPHDHQPGKVSYFPNRLGGAAEHQRGRRRGLPVGGPQGSARHQGARAQPELSSLSPGDAFWNSLSDWETDHIARHRPSNENQVGDEGVAQSPMNEIAGEHSPDWPRWCRERTVFIAVETLPAQRTADTLGTDAVGPQCARRDTAALAGQSAGQGAAPPQA